jgi:hypothetical protein
MNNHGHIPPKVGQVWKGHFDREEGLGNQIFIVIEVKEHCCKVKFRDTNEMTTYGTYLHMIADLMDANDYIGPKSFNRLSFL